MIILNNKKYPKSAAKIDTDIIALYVFDDDVEDTIDMLITTIVTKCLMEFGEPPEVLE